MKSEPGIVITLSLFACGAAPLSADEWSLPNGQTITTQAGSTPPVIGAKRVSSPAKQVQPSAGQPTLQVVVPSAPSFGQLQGLLPKPSWEAIKTSQFLSDARVGQNGGECAVFAQHARPELLGFGNANQMPDTARKNGFEVDGTPRVGSVMVIAKPVGSTYGHAEVVTSTAKVGDKYVLTVMDSNANQDAIISSRTVYYTPSVNGTFGNYGKYEEATPGLTKLAKDLIVMGFIQNKPASTTKMDSTDNTIKP